MRRSLLPLCRSTVAVLVMQLCVASSPGRADIAADYDAAKNACSQANTAQDISMALWGATAALCGGNCINYLVTLSAARKNALTAAQNLQRAITTSTPCVAVATYNTVIAPIIAKISSAFSLAEGGAAKGAANSAVAANAPAVGSAAGETTEVEGDEEMALFGMQATSTGTAASTAASTSAATFCAETYGGQQQCAACTKAIADTTHATTLNQTAQTNLTAAIQSVISWGKACAFTSVGVGVADFAITEELGKDTTLAMISVVGAAPGLYDLVKLYILKNQTANAGSTASMMGVSSCFSAGLSAAELAIKLVDSEAESACAKANQLKEQEIQGAGGSALPPSTPQPSPQAFLNWTDNLVAWFDPSCWGAELSACQASPRTRASFVNCAMAGDNTLARFKAEDLENVLSAYESQYQIPEEQVLSGPRTTIDQVAKVMTYGHPEYMDRMMNFFHQTEEHVKEVLPSLKEAAARRPHLATVGSQTLSPPVDGLAASPPDLSANPGLGGAGEVQLSQRAPSSEKQELDRGDDLFRSVSERYRVRQVDLEVHEWAVPSNRGVYHLPPEGSR